MFKSLNRYLKKQKKKHAIQRKKELIKKRKEEKRERDKEKREEKRERDKDRREEKKLRELEKREMKEQHQLDKMDRAEDVEEKREKRERKKYEFKEEKRKRKFLSTIIPIIVCLLLIVFTITYINKNYTRIDKINKKDSHSKALSIIIDGKSQVKIGSTLTLKSYVESELPNEKTNWKTDDKTIAEVNSLGVVTAKKSGSTFITAYTDNGVSAKKKITVTIDKIKPEKINVLCNISVMKVRDVKQLNVKIENTNKRLSFTSNDNNLATISSTGKITARKKGKVIITIKADNKELTTCNIEIEK